MELRLQKFVDTMSTLADIRNIDISNPVVFNLEHPVTAQRFTVTAALYEPSYMGLPINVTWTVLDPSSTYYKRCLKLVSYQDPSVPIDGVTLLPGFHQSWKLIETYDEIFDTPQYYDNGAGGGTTGPKGDTGPAGNAGANGATGPKGDTPVIDYDAIIAEVLTRIPSVVPTLSIAGADSVVEGSTSPYTFSMKVGQDVIPLALPLVISGDTSAASISPFNVLTALSVLSDSAVTLKGDLSFNGQSYTASKDVAILNAGLSSIAISGNVASLFEGQTSQLVVTASYSNGTNKAVTGNVTWSVSPASGAAVSSSGVLTASAVTADTNVTVTATYTESGTTKTANFTFVNKNIIVTSIAISGAASLNEGASTSYTATVTRNNGSTSVVTPSWSCDVPIGSITAAGVLTAATVSANTTGNVTAVYQYEGVTVTASKAVTVNNVATVIYPYYGAAASSAVINSAFVLSLPGRGPSGSKAMSPLTIIDSATTSLYYAYPVSYGLATFTDLGNNFQGGWDGAHKDNGGTNGPVTVNVTIDGVSVPFYVYQADYPNISPASNPTNWAVA